MQIPATTVEFLDALKARKGLSTDYQLFKALGWKQTTVSSYRRGRSAMAGPHAIRVADELGLPREYVLACMEAERENNDQVADVWRELAHRLRGIAASILLALLLGVGLLGYAKTALAAGFAALPVVPATSSHCIYYVKLIMRWLGRLADCLNPPPLLAA